jgi:ATP diphosphatase
MTPQHLYSLPDLLRVMSRLRDPEYGCPWDLQQDFASIVPSTLEEVYELAEAIECGDFPHVAEELGDVLFQVIFHAQLGAEQQLFDFEQIVHTLVDKLVRRHPHVFAHGDIEGVVAANASVESVAGTWEQIKRSERLARSLGTTMADIPHNLPALSRAQKVQKRASGAGFDWTDIDGVLDKLNEELAELQEARSQSKARQEDELGDLLFCCVNLSRHLGLDAEAALRRATRKFENRFDHMEAAVRADGGDLSSQSAASYERLWALAKRAD